MQTVNLNAARTKLLYVCNADALRAKYPTHDVDGLLHAIDARARLLPVTGSATDCAALVHAAIADAPGVVLLGGYDVVPSRKISCLPEGSTADPATDTDGFIVWSDDFYGDLDDDGLPELPVSRVPDAGSFEFFVQLLNAPDLAPTSPYGLINRLRPFAVKVFESIPHAVQDRLQLSVPVNLKIEGNPKPDLRDSNVAYFMLHGVIDDGRRFRGQFDAHTLVEAFHTSSAASFRGGGFVFTGCCWGALIVEPDAPGAGIRPRRPEDSIALTILGRGAVAFIGSTGVHYSPIADGPHVAPDASDDYLCKPLHSMFWERYAQGLAPAKALFEAKLDYFEGIPYAGAPFVPDVQTAIEVKNCFEMTCLGLGW